MATKKLHEMIADDLGSQTPEPTMAGNPHANRIADNTNAGEPMLSYDTRMAFMGGIINLLPNLNRDQLESMYMSAQSYINGGMNASAGGSARPASTNNMGTLNPGAASNLPQMPRVGLGESISTELKTLLEESNLGEDFTEKASVIFEVAVSSRVALKEAKLQEEYETKLQEAVQQNEEELNESIEEILEGLDAYTTLVAKTWLEENKLAVDTGLKVQISENLIAGLKNLIEENQIFINEDDLSIVEKLETAHQANDEALAEALEINEKLSSELGKLMKEKVIKENHKDLTLTEQEKLISLCESIPFDEPESFKRKVVHLKETYIKGKPSSTPSTTKTVLTEDTNKSNQSSPTYGVDMNLIAEIAKTLGQR